MSTASIPVDLIRRIHQQTSPEFKSALEQALPSDFFEPKDITEKIISFEAACEYNNTNPRSPRFIYGTRNQIYQERVAEIVKALNEGFIFDWDNENEYKFSPVFWLDSPGFRFCVSTFVLTYSYAAGGSRFAFKNRKLSDFAGKHFLDEYKNWLMPCNEEAILDQPIVVSANKDFKGDLAAWEAYIIPRTGSFEAACQEAGVCATDPRFGVGTSDEVAYRKGKLFCDVLNAPFADNMKDTTSRKWSAWMDKTDPGFRFRVSLCAITNSLTAGGSRLRLCSEKLSKHFAVTLIETMAPYWWNE